MGKWETVRLGDLCNKIESKNPCKYKKHIIYYDISSIDSETKKITSSNVISPNDAPSRARQKVFLGDILVSTVRPNLNAVAMVEHPADNLIASTGFCVLRPDTRKVNRRYLFQFVQSPSFVFSMTRQATGASYPAVSNKIVQSEALSLPPLPIQQQIADTLDRASALLEKRKAQINKLDLLVKSQFVEMFGDPVINPMEWKCQKLSSMGEINRGVSKHRPRNDPKLLGGLYPFIQTGDVANSGLFIESYTNTYSDLGLAQSKIWKKGTMCITIAANIAKTSILAFDACFPDSVVGYLPNNKTNTFFIYSWFSFFQKILEEQAPESAQKNINLKILYDLEVICPPLSLQTQFADFVQQVEAQKQLLQASLAKLELQYKSLMQKCFRGEIF